MLCTVELELAGLCISIPTLRPFYLRWRERYKSSHYSNTDDPSKASHRPQLGGDKPGHYTVWMELVLSRSPPFSLPPYCPLAVFLSPICQIPVEYLVLTSLRMTGTTRLAATTTAPSGSWQGTTPSLHLRITSSLITKELEGRHTKGRRWCKVWLLNGPWRALLEGFSSEYPEYHDLCILPRVIFDTWDNFPTTDLKKKTLGPEKLRIRIRKVRKLWVQCTVLARRAWAEKGEKCCKNLLKSVFCSLLLFLF